MKSKSQLKAWAVDRVIEAKKAGVDGLQSLKDIEEAADKLAAYCHDPELDFNDATARLCQLLKESPDALLKAQHLIAELTVIQEEIERQQAMQNAGQPQGAVQ